MSSHPQRDPSAGGEGIFAASYRGTTFARPLINRDETWLQSHSTKRSTLSTFHKQNHLYLISFKWKQFRRRFRVFRNTRFDEALISDEVVQDFTDLSSFKSMKFWQHEDLWVANSVCIYQLRGFLKISRAFHMCDAYSGRKGLTAWGGN